MPIEILKIVWKLLAVLAVFSFLMSVFYKDIARKPTVSAGLIIIGLFRRIYSAHYLFPSSTDNINSVKANRYLYRFYILFGLVILVAVLEFLIFNK